MSTKKTADIDLELGIAPPPNLPSELYTALVPIYSALYTLAEYVAGRLIRPDYTLANTNIPVDKMLREHAVGRLYVIATETINAGEAVNLYYDGSGITKARRADASAASAVRYCNGFSTSDKNVVNTELLEVTPFMGICRNANGSPGLLAGQAYWLSTNGTIAASAPTTAGHLAQFVGIALNTNDLLFFTGQERRIV